MKQVRNREKGQMTLFFAINFIIVITLIAFVINVGLYVKAKINLQNAVDAAAWSGAAVQARQLTRIAHLNYSMRNTYKEWMFKYYILGQWGLPFIQSPGSYSGGISDFRTKQFANNGGQFSLATPERYNLPSICIHFPGVYNICKVSSVPGLPRFENDDILGIDQVHDNYLNTIIQTRTQNCAFRSKLNFSAALAWAYGAGSGGGLQQNGPDVAVRYPGAFPRALEIAIRIRNQEKLVNTPPQGAVCTNATYCSTPISSLESQNFAGYERVVKAFYSAYRNLGNNRDNELKESLVLTELSPQEYSPANYSPHLLLIPSDADKRKFYLDLRLTILNLVTYYTAFSGTVETDSTIFQGTPGEGACDAVKIGMPIPGYPFGFDKNPEVVTYYALKGEAQYNGLFNPFGKSLKLVAYSSAKPFGGRIGPRLFDASGSNILTRNLVNKSAHYLSAPVSGYQQFQKGDPVPSPLNSAIPFWSDPDNPSFVGGWPNSATSAPLYSVPNLLYELTQNMTSSAFSHYDKKIQAIGDNQLGQLGLYNKEQFLLFRSHLDAGAQQTIDAQIIDETLKKLKSPTYYEALNYLIPVPEITFQGHPLDSVGYVAASNNPEGQVSIDAPLFGDGLLFSDRDAILEVLEEFIAVNTPAVDAFVSGMETQAQSIQNAFATSSANPQQAAELFYKTPLTCDSIAGLFKNFYSSSPLASNCGSTLKNIKDEMDSYLQKIEQGSTGGSQLLFQDNYYAPQVSPQGAAATPLGAEYFLTGFFPTKAQGGRDDGIVKHPFLPQKTIFSKRNYYSTKFVPFSLLSGGQKYPRSFSVFSEGGYDLAHVEDFNYHFQNYLKVNIPSQIKH